MNTSICLKLKNSDDIGHYNANIIKFIKLLRQYTSPSLDLKTAKTVADGIKEGREIELLIAANLLANFESELKQYPVIISKRAQTVEQSPTPKKEAICTLHLNAFRKIHKKICSERQHWRRLK